MRIPPVGQFGFAQVANIHTTHDAIAGRRLVKSGDDMQQRALTGTARPHQRYKLTCMNIKRDTIERGDFDFAVAIKLG